VGNSVGEELAAQGGVHVFEADGGLVGEPGSHEAARADVFCFIEVEYNRTRLRKHPEFGYLTPLETRTLLQPDLTPAA
jgi:hypothetical protein